MPSKKICKTVRQYSRGPVSPEAIQRRQEIAEDYRKVKNYVYARFGSIGSLAELCPGYMLQNEMTASGCREALGKGTSIDAAAVGKQGKSGTAVYLPRLWVPGGGENQHRPPCKEAGGRGTG